MNNLPKPMQSGHVGYLIESYPVGQTVSNLKDEVQDKGEVGH